MSLANDALGASLIPADDFLSSVYDDDAGHIRDIDGHAITAIFCRRLSAVPTLRDLEIVKTGLPLSLSKNFDGAGDNVIKVQFIAGQFRSSFSGVAPSSEEQAALDDIIEVYNFQPHDLGAVKLEKGEGAALDVDVPPIKRDNQIISEPADVVEEVAALNETKEKLPPVIDNAADLSVTIFSAPSEISSDEPPSETLENTAFPETEELAPQQTIEPVISTVPIQSEASNFNATCQLIASNKTGLTKKLPISAAGLQNSLSAMSVFSFPTPEGLALRGVQCQRNSLIPAEHDHKVARAGYPFLYFVNDVNGMPVRVAALEFVGGKYRMNLIKGDFTDQELIDAKARILSFNAQRMQENAAINEGDEK